MLLQYTPGPIPARAGQPATASMRPAKSWAYPRACGATARATGQTSRARGLSPRVRGNQLHRSTDHDPSGPIPARAGQPASKRGRCTASRAYPRACGATFDSGTQFLPFTGLSPRVRGNRLHNDHVVLQVGPIPARAGQPGLEGIPGSGKRAYPRACGATAVFTLLNILMVGLSPRVRGNPDFLTMQNLRAGPIPARAGQPYQGGIQGVFDGAYPRACGATRKCPP